ncbi:hypothetical protein E3T42_12595 [Cryobacterium sp. TMT4-10]|uniref:Uncharacterized protein n=1 Tax=Cryobacterium shii TaxID=1259235 RepID=A0AAQ2C5R6_9MICO|nr:hypothetical protein E3O49_09205 [Cryobacterium shii]TFD14122.1 hypothetical protein E3T42_12595 [Cryobacterium sp. TMT4-10]TFD22718.1 hypothetical protein E3T32_06535 [Cryobacterium sp. TMT2-23]
MSTTVSPAPDSPAPDSTASDSPAPDSPAPDSADRCSGCWAEVTSLFSHGRAGPRLGVPRAAAAAA